MVMIRENKKQENYITTIIPLIVVYLILSKYIVAGVALGGVKG